MPINKIHLPLFSIIVFAIVIIGIYYPVDPTTNTKNSVDHIDIDAIINDVVNKLKLDRNNPEVIYELYYSGRILSFTGRDLPAIIGLSPKNIVFAYYHNGSWYYLPMRIYDEKITTNVTIVYTLPKTISNETIFEVRMPRYPPLEVDYTKHPPPFARMSRCIELTLVEPQNDTVLGTLYLFIGGSVNTLSPGHIYTIENYGINDEFTASEPSMLIDYMRKAGYDSKTIYEVTRTISGETIYVGNELLWRITLGSIVS